MVLVSSPTYFPVRLAPVATRSGCADGCAGGAARDGSALAVRRYDDWVGGWVRSVARWGSFKLLRDEVLHHTFVDGGGN